MLWFKEVVLFCFFMDTDKRRTYYVALFWHCQASDLILRAACRQHRAIHMSHSLPKYYRNWIHVGLVLKSILDCLLTKQNIFSSFAMYTSASTSYHLPSVTGKGRFSQSLCVWLVWQCHRKAKTLGPQSISILFWGPFTGQFPGSEGDPSALGRVTQSEHRGDPCPRTPQSSVLLTASTGGGPGGLTLNPLWSNTINVIENYNMLRFQDCWC